MSDVASRLKHAHPPYPIVLPVLLAVSLSASAALQHYYPPQPSDTRAFPTPVTAHFYERPDWWSEAGLRAVEVLVGMECWRRARGWGVDAGLLGVVVGLVGRLPLAVFQHAHFLLPLSTLASTLPLALLPTFLALLLLPYLCPPAPRYKPSHHRLSSFAWSPPTLPTVATYALGIALATLLGGLWSFAGECLGFLELVAGNAVARGVPAKLSFSGDALEPSFIMSHPTLAFPTLRAPAPTPMPHLLALSLASSVLPPLLLPAGAPTPVAPLLACAATFLTVSPAGVAPLVGWAAAAAVSAEAAAKVALGQAVVGFVVEDVRRAAAAAAAVDASEKEE